MGKPKKILPEDGRNETNQKLRNKLNDRKQQVLRLKRTIQEMEKTIEKLTEELKCFKEGIEYIPKDISRPKKLTPLEKKQKKELEDKVKKEEALKKIKEKFGKTNKNLDDADIKPVD